MNEHYRTDRFICVDDLMRRFDYLLLKIKNEKNSKGKSGLLSIMEFLRRRRDFTSSFYINNIVIGNVNYIYNKYEKTIDSLKKEIGNSINIILRRIKLDGSIIDPSVKYRRIKCKENESNLINSEAEVIWNL